MRHFILLFSKETITWYAGFKSLVLSAVAYHYGNNLAWFREDVLKKVAVIAVVATENTMVLLIIGAPPIQGSFLWDFRVLAICPDFTVF